MRCRAPVSFWSKRSHQRQFFDQIAAGQLQISRWEEWYRVRVLDVTRLGGRGLLKHHEGSLIGALQAVYPEFRWRAWCFAWAPRGFWESDDNARQFLQSMAADDAATGGTDEYTRQWLGERRRWQWSTLQFSLAKGGWLVKKHHGIEALLARYGGGMGDNRESRTEGSSSSTQTHLLAMLQQLLPAQELLQNCRPASLSAARDANRDHQEKKKKIGKRLLELDTFLPELALAIEYQGGQHFRWSGIHGSPLRRQRNDSEKQEVRVHPNSPTRSFPRVSSLY